MLTLLSIFNIVLFSGIAGLSVQMGYSHDTWQFWVLLLLYLAVVFNSCLMVVV